MTFTPLRRFYAHWCKSCQKFGMKYRHLAFEEGDRIGPEGAVVRPGEVRFAEAEYTASAKLCKSLRVKKLPTVHMFRRGRGKVADMTCKPSMFHLVVDEMRRLLDAGLTAVPVESVAEVQLEETMKMERNVNVTDTTFDGLSDEIMTLLKKKKKAAIEKEKSTWFPFA